MRFNACAELRLQVLQGSYKSNGCDTKMKIMRLKVGSKNEGPQHVLLVMILSLDNSKTIMILSLDNSKNISFSPELIPR